MAGSLKQARTIVHTWLSMDFFGDPSRDTGSALTSTIFSQSFFAFLIALVLFDPGHVSVAGFTAANLSFSTLLVGIGALADPQRASRRRRADDALLRTAPLDRGALVLARAMHGAFYVVLITTGMAIPPAVFTMFLDGGSASAVPHYLIHACLLSSMCAAGIALVLRATERLAGRSASLLLAGTLRAVLLGGGFIAFALCLRLVDDTVEALPFDGVLAWAWPPYWSARALAAPSALAPFGYLVALGLALALLHRCIPELSNERHRARRSPSFAPLASIERWLAGAGPLLGATRFVAVMLFRSAEFRAKVLPLLGVPVAMTILSFLGEGDDATLFLGMAMQFPAIYLPFLIGFLPNAERPGTGRVFRTSPSVTPELCRDATRIALTTRVLTPVLLLATVLAIAAGLPITTGLLLLSFSWGAAVLFALLQTRAIGEMPFSVDSAGHENADFGSVVAIGVVLGGAGAAFAKLSAHSSVAPIGPILALVAAHQLSRLRRRDPVPA